MELKPGARLRSAVDDVEVVVVKAPEGSIDLCCGGHPMVAIGDDPQGNREALTGFDSGTAVGKRYADADGHLELLCTKAGSSSLSIGDVPLELKGAKPLPSTD